LQTVDTGDALPVIEFIDINGSPASLKFGDNKKHLIFVYSVYCEFCKNDFSLWNDLITKSQSTKYKFHAISLDSQIDTANNLDTIYEALRAITIIARETNIRRTYRLSATPTTMIVSNQGVVEWTYIGRLNPEKLQEIKLKLAA
jgi:peroxiredoxin